MAESLRILVTGDRADLEARYPKEGKDNGRKFEWVSFPVLEFERLPVDFARLEEVISKPRDWILFTSPRAVSFWTDALLEAGLDFPVETQVACIGQQTAESAGRDGYTPDFYPTEPGSEVFLEEFEALVMTNSRKPSVVIPMAEGGRTTIFERLRELDCQVETLFLYKTLPAKDLPRRYSQQTIDQFAAILFTSPSSVDAFCQNFKIPQHTRLGALGLFTSSHLSQLGLKHKVLPRGDFQKIGEIL